MERLTCRAAEHVEFRARLRLDDVYDALLRVEKINPLENMYTTQTDNAWDGIKTRL